MTCRAVLVLAAFILVSAPLPADNWPHWRGPPLNGVSAETNLPVKWSKTENIAWTLAMPARSGSTPIIWGDHIFLNVAEGSNLYLWAVDRNTGAVRWKQLLGGGNRDDAQAEHVVAVAGDRRPHRSG